MNASAPSIQASVPEPRAPGRGLFRWSDVFLPLLLCGVMVALVLFFDVQGAGFAMASVPAFGVLAVFLGHRIGKRQTRGSWGSDLFRGALTAELLTLGMAAVMVVWSPDPSSGGYDAGSLIFPVAFAHIFGLPTLLAAAAFGVSLGHPPVTSTP